MMTTDILEEHLAEIALLWELRRTAIASPDFVLGQLARLERRIELHAKGLVYGRPLELLEKALGQDESATVFAAAYALLRLEDAGANKVLKVFPKAKEGQLDGLREALCHGGNEKILKQLDPWMESAPPAVQAAFLETLACHSRLRPDPQRLEQFLSDESLDVRLTAWRICGRTGCIDNRQLFETGFNDKDAQVRRESLSAAAWTQQKFLLAHCRKGAAKPAPDTFDAVLLLAILGKPDELQRILYAGKSAELGPKRFQVLGAYGHPESVEELIQGMDNRDPRSAVAAGVSFAKLTGVNVESNKRVQLPPEDGSEPDEFEKEFLDEAKLPDVQKARDHWTKVKPQFSGCSRICRGFDLSNGTTPKILDQLDMESRWEALFRGKFEGKWQGGPFDLERFPQPMQPANAPK